MDTREMVAGVLFLLLGVVGAIPHALVLIPSEIQLGSPEKLCVVQPAGEGGSGGSLRVTLFYARANVTLLQLETQDIGAHGCIQFTAPEVELGNEWNSGATVTVIGSGELAAINITKKVLLKKYHSLTFVQTDKPVYKPGQTVRFRVVSLDQDFQPTLEKYPLITLTDIGQYRIGQWLGVEGRQGIVDLSFDLIPDSPMGSYTIQVQTSSEKVTHSFSVEEYVLPKFELKVHLPEQITILDTTIPIKVCGRYTYGKPMRGDVNGTVCLQQVYYRRSQRNCHIVTGKTDTDGCFSTDLSTDTFRIRTNRRSGNIHAHFVVAEEGTGITREGSGSCQVSSEVTTISFEEVEDYYKTGIPYTGKVKVKYVTGRPFANARIYLFNSQYPGAQQVVADERGMATFTFKTSTWEMQPVQLLAIYQLLPEHFHYTASVPRHAPARHSIKPFYSKSGSFISIGKVGSEMPCDSQLDLPINYVFQNLPQEAPLHLDLFHLVMAKGKIISLDKTLIVGGDARYGEGDGLGWRASQGELTLTLHLPALLAPTARLLVFTALPSGEMVAHSAHIHMDKCFRNKVQLGFSVPEELPGSQVSLHVGAAPGSLCGLRIVDHSVLLLKPERELTAQSVYSLLPVTDLDDYPYSARDYDSHNCVPEPDDSLLSLYDKDSVTDVAQLLQGLGLKVFTDLDYQVPLNCETQRRVAYARYGAEGMPGPPERVQNVMYSMVESGAARDSLGPRQLQVRQYFPETWLWDLIPVGPEGRASVELTIPDAITEWKGSVFCNGETGFGLSPTASFTTFKPFFLELALPYAVVRSEGFTLKAKLFNYLAHSLMVKVTLQEAQGFELKSSDSQVQVCVLSTDSVTVSWNLTATGLGEVNVTVAAESVLSATMCGNEVVSVPERGAVDIVRRSLLIQPEGSETELTHSSLLCPAGRSVTEEIVLQVREDVVEGSERASITVLGDLMGSAMDNLDGLLRLPTGCGEQNMVKFTPNIVVLSYLEKTHQLSPKIRSKAVGFLQTGYQRQLTYKHLDGSFSAFGSSDPEGNTWLTAFVLRSFLHSLPPIPSLPKAVLREPVPPSPPLPRPPPSGCFARHRAALQLLPLKGGVDDTVSLSAYVTTSLLELQRLRPTLASQVYEKSQNRRRRRDLISDLDLESALVQPLPSDFKTDVLGGSLDCLRQALGTVNNTYTLALLAYAFTLAGDEPSRDSTLLRLDALAINEDGQTHWGKREGGESGEEELRHWWRAPSAEVETTAYVLLALLSPPNISPTQLQRSSPIVRWLVRQRNSYGGFASTQDTVVALQALSLYAALTYSPEPLSSVSLSGPDGFQQGLHIDAHNRLVVQRAALPGTGTYTGIITGNSCVLLQASLRYHTLPSAGGAAFHLSLHLEPYGNTEGKLHINVTYTGSRNVSNMVIVNVKMLSGYSPQTTMPVGVSRIESKDGHFLMYIEKMDAGQTLPLSVRIFQEFPVENLQEAQVSVYDYYVTDEAAIAGYKWPTSSKE
ncbi:LOW QUALITY PROTEIN: murinoglobulin-2-like [Leucoraja erinacea]|uniref:LOW QUALITY PROTEIN: murinoglobulin-2-like n=1 Tax=Leucoraja erinaceus TaxID=7782 RepID=UPI002455AB83|nr:LOW QUALITY PROTEIN: murinoglobulin-2-like [Leucoraja erinacea]